MNSKPEGSVCHAAEAIARPLAIAWKPDPSCSAMVSSQALLGGRSEVVITHGDEAYRLRQTRQGKLILTK